MLRAIVKTSLIFAALALGPSGPFSGGSVSANPGDQIAHFLQDAQQHHFGLDLWHLKRNFNAPDVGPVPPKEESVNAKLRIIDGDRGKGARTVLTQALQVVGEAPGATFQPDYCVIYTDGTNEPSSLQILWISSDSANLQMRYFASDGASDECRIAEGTPGNVRQMLRQLILNSVSNAIRQMVDGIDYLGWPFDLMSLDPKQSDDVFGHKRWNVLGKVPLTPREREQLFTATGAIIRAIDFPPAYTARSFTPRLAVSVKVPSLATVLMDLNKSLPKNLRSLVTCGESVGSLLLPPSASLARQPSGYQYVVLMSFECRLAELYVDGKPQGFCALADGWTRREKPESASASKLPSELASDQSLNDILVKANKPLKPKSASSGN